MGCEIRCIVTSISILSLRFNSSLLGLQHLSDNLLLLNQKGSYDPRIENIQKSVHVLVNRKQNNLLFPHAVVAQATSISAVYFLLSKRHALPFMGASRSDTSQCGLAHTTFGDLPWLLLVLVGEFTTWSTDTVKQMGDCIYRVPLAGELVRDE